MMTEVRAHETVLLDEAVSAVLGPLNGVYLDGTFGRGGHSRLLLRQLGDDALLIGVDKDPVAVSVGQDLAAIDARFEIEHASFTQIDEFLTARSLPGFNGVLVDLGVSSPQIDEAERGFSFMNDGPLDMRMDPTSGQSAAQWVNTVPEKQLVAVLREYGEERFAKRIAAAIVSERTKKPFETTAHLASVVSEANPAWEKHKHPATRVFQAIRIQINNELGDLAEFLVKASTALVVGGRLVVISFHSLEDRMVKRFMKDLAKGDEPPPGVPVFDKDIARHFKLLSKAIKPSKQEVENNPRARSAVMRILEKVSDA